MVCLGDSVTFGYRVPTVWPDKPRDYDPSWAALSDVAGKRIAGRKSTKQIEVITMAVPGYTSHQGLAWLQRDIDRLKPDLLTISFGWNDASFSDVPDREAIKTNWRAVTVRWLVDHSQAFAHATHWLRSRQPSSAKVVRPTPRVCGAGLSKQHVGDGPTRKQPTGRSGHYRGALSRPDLQSALKLP